MKNKLIKISIFILLFLSIQINSFGESLENLKNDIDKSVVHPKEEVTLKIDFGRLLREFEINIAYDKNLFLYYSANKDINLYDNGDVVTLTYPTMSSKEAISEIEIIFKAKKEITTTNPTDLKVTLQNMKDSLTNELIENPLLPIEKELVVEPVYKDYQFFLEHDDRLTPNKEINMKLILKSDMGQIYQNAKIYATITSEKESEVQINATDLLGKEYNILEEGWGGENGESIGGENISKELNLNTIFSDSGNYKITFELKDLNNSDFVIASQKFNLKVEDEVQTLNSINKTDNIKIENMAQNKETISSEETKLKENKISSTNEIIYKPSTLPKAGGTIYFLILPSIGILILIYCIFKKKDENF